MGQEADEAVRENAGETEATINTSVTEITINEPEVTVSETRTEDAIIETIVNVFTADKGVPMETEDVVT